MSDIKRLRDTYTSLYGVEGCSNVELEKIEQSLGVNFPEDFKEIANFYSGGLLGGISHYEIANTSEATNITQETLRIRGAIGLDEKFVVLAEPSGSIIVLNVSGRPAVIWCDAVEVENLNTMVFSNKPDLWDDYSSFFAYLLDEEENE